MSTPLESACRSHGSGGYRIAMCICGWLASGLIGCSTADAPPSAATATLPSAPQSLLSQPDPVDDQPIRRPFRFELIKNSGLDFTYYGNPSPKHYMTEQNGGGVALFDYDQDGWCDAFLTNGSDFTHPAENKEAVHQLARNVSSAGGIRFENVSRPSQLAVSGFGMGVAAGDFDNDGFPDLCICYYGRVELWHNAGDGTFHHVSSSAGIADASWSAGAAFADLDDDGDLDMYVTNYVDYASTDPPCFTEHRPPVMISCGPIGRIAQHDTLWENRSDGTFLNVSEPAGIRAVEPGKGLAVEIVDLNGDRRLDVYVANDTSPNFLFLNEGGLRFSEQGVVSGVAVGADGGAESSMGIACADFDGNGWFDLFVTNFENSLKDYYDHVAPTAFVHRSGAMGLDTTSRPLLSFGTIGADFDLDQWPDLFVANGHIWDLTSLGFGHQYAMPQQLFWNDQGRRFHDVSRAAGDYFEDKWLGRAAATSDFDHDGLPDLLVTHLIRPATVVHNASERRGSSVRLRLIGRSAARMPLGISLSYRCGDKTATTHIPSGGSFAASHDPHCLLSVGQSQVIDELIVHWSSHHSEVWRGLNATRELTLLERTGEKWSPPETNDAASSRAKD